MVVFKCPNYFSNIRKKFSALKHVLTYLSSSVSQKRLHNCISQHVHKKSLDGIDAVDVAKEFILVNDERIKYFGSFNS